MLFGMTAIHAASAATGKGALLFLGESGAGKSTLSAFLGRLGWDVLSDDISMLLDGQAPKVAPSTTGICVWADSRAALELPQQQCRPLAGYPGKVRYVPGGVEGTELVPLRTVIILDRSMTVEVPTLLPVSTSQALIQTAKHRIRFNPGDTSGKETLANFKQLSQIVDKTPCYRLAYPANYSALPRVADVLAEIVTP